MESTEVNINDYCEVTLTNDGLKCLRKYLEDLKVPDMEQHYIILATRSGFSMWELMSIFGPMCCNGGPNLFKNNKIKITERK